MSEIIKNGKKPISSKRKPTVESFTTDDLAGENLLKLDAELQRELEEQGLEGHFLNATILQKNYGRHKNGWQVYKRKSPSSPQGFRFGEDPDGYVRAGDLILAVLPKEKVERKRAANQFKTDRLAQSNKTQADALRKQAQEMGISAQIHEGYEENE